MASSQFDDIAATGNVVANGVVSSSRFQFGGPGVITAFSILGSGPITFEPQTVAPNTGGGLQRPTGSLVIVFPPGTPSLWQKTGTAPTAWTEFEASGGPAPLVGPTLDLTPALTPPAIPALALVENYSPTGSATATVWRLSSLGTCAIGGIVLAGGNVDGRVLILENVGTHPITLNYEDAGSTAANRFSTPQTANVTLQTLDAATLIYDATAARWRVWALAQVAGVSSTLTLSPAITPPAIAATANNYAPTGGAGASVWRLSTSGGPHTVTGLLLDVGGNVDGRVLILNNEGPDPITFANLSGSSAAANQLANVDGENWAIPFGGGITYVYDGASTVWRMVAAATDMFPAIVVAGSSIFDTNLTVNGVLSAAAFSLTPSLTPPPIGSTQNNYTPTGGAASSLWYLSTSSGAGQNITGLALDVGGNRDGRELVLVNLGPGPLSFVNLSGSSSAANQLANAAGALWTVPVGGSIAYAYDGGAAVWQMLWASTTTLPSLEVGGTATFDAAVNLDGATTLQPGAVLDLQSTVLLDNVITPTAFTGAAVNNYSPTGYANANTIRQGASAATTLTGLLAKAGGAIVVLENISTVAITLTNNDAGSTAANRFLTPGAVSLVVPAGGAVVLVYDATSTAWRATSLATSSAGRLLKTSYLTAGTTLTVTAQTTSILAKLQGAGGGGAGCGPTTTSLGAGGGGGAGGYVEKTYAVTPGQAVTFSLGGGGAGGATASNNTGAAGSAGTDSTFTSNAVTITAHGGGGAPVFTPTTTGNIAKGGVGGLGSGGDLNVQGAPGGYGVAIPTALLAQGGVGGVTAYGSPGYGGNQGVSPIAPTAASGAGVGGGGGANITSGTESDGTAGAGAQLVVLEFS